MSSAFAGHEQEQPVWGLKGYSPSDSDSMPCSDVVADSELEDLIAFLDTQKTTINPALTDLRTAPPPAEYPVWPLR